MTRSAFAVLLLGAVSTASSAPPQVREFMTASGLRDQLTSLAASVPQQLESSAAVAGHAPEVREVTRKAMAQAFTANRLIAAAEDSLGRDQDAAPRLAQILAYLKSPAGRKLVTMEAAAARPESQRELEAFAAGLQKAPPARARIVLAQELEQAQGASDFAVQVIASTTVNLARAMAESLPGEKKPGDAELQAMMAQMRSKLEEPMRSAVLVQLLFTYQAASDAELSAYVQWLRTPTGLSYVRLGNDAIMDALIAAAEDAGKRMATELKALKKAAGAAPKAP